MTVVGGSPGNDSDCQAWGPPAGLVETTRVPDGTSTATQRPELVHEMESTGAEVVSAVCHVDGPPAGLADT
jgi:hypothetical protein